MALCTLLLPPLRTKDKIYSEVGAEIELDDDEAKALMAQGVVNIISLSDDTQPLEPTTPEKLEGDRAPAEQNHLDQGGAVNFNTASLDELTALKYIGKASAQRIIDGRPYETLEAAQAAARLSDEYWAEIKAKVMI